MKTGMRSPSYVAGVKVCHRPFLSPLPPAFHSQRTGIAQVSRQTITTETKEDVERCQSLWACANEFTSPQLL